MGPFYQGAPRNFNGKRAILIRAAMSSIAQRRRPVYPAHPCKMATPPRGCRQIIRSRGNRPFPRVNTTLERKSSEAGFTGFEGSAGLQSVSGAAIPILIIPKIGSILLLTIPRKRESGSCNDRRGGGRGNHKGCPYVGVPSDVRAGSLALRQPYFSVITGLFPSFPLARESRNRFR